MIHATLLLVRVRKHKIMNTCRPVYHGIVEMNGSSIDCAASHCEIEETEVENNVTGYKRSFEVGRETKSD